MVNKELQFDINIFIEKLVILRITYNQNFKTFFKYFLNLRIKIHVKFEILLGITIYLFINYIDTDK